MNELETEAFFLRCYTLEHTKRYSMVPVIKEESVASHSYFVALGVMLLHEHYDFDLEVALKMALLHDLPEIEISDVNHLVKKKYPDLADAIRKVEHKISQLFPEILRNTLECYATRCNESVIVHYVDAMQCWQYALSEMSMGNGNMTRVKLNSQKRMVEMKPLIEEFRRGDK